MEIIERRIEILCGSGDEGFDVAERIGMIANIVGVIPIHVTSIQDGKAEHKIQIDTNPLKRVLFKAALLRAGFEF